MRRLLAAAALAAAAVAAARLLSDRRDSVAWQGNGHSHDQARLVVLRQQIAAAGNRLRGSAQ
jgi:hypothetical protein